MKLGVKAANARVARTENSSGEFREATTETSLDTRLPSLDPAPTHVDVVDVEEGGEETRPAEGGSSSSLPGAMP